MFRNIDRVVINLPSNGFYIRDRVVRVLVPTFGDLLFLIRRGKLSYFDMNDFLSRLVDGIWDFCVQDRDVICLYVFFEFFIDRVRGSGKCRACGKDLEGSFLFKDFIIDILDRSPNVKVYVDGFGVCDLSLLTVREEEYVNSLMLSRELDFLYKLAMLIKSFSDYNDRVKFLLQNKDEVLPILLSYKENFNFGIRGELKILCDCGNYSYFNVGSILDMVNFSNYSFSSIDKLYNSLVKVGYCGSYLEFLQFPVNFLDFLDYGSRG